jgi:DNA-binding LacI/PurR family transcriptional regulator
MPSISDVAKQAGVSPTTVSRVLTQSSHPVNEKTRERVLMAASELGFTPNALARALVKDKTNIIGVLVGDVSDPYFGTIMRGINEVANENGYLTIVCNSYRVGETELKFVRLLRDYHADGIIFAGGGLTDPDYLLQITDLLAQFNERNVPVVVLGHHGFNAPAISIDNSRAAQEMTEYLIQLGNRHIGFIAGPSSLTTSAIRTEGYRQALLKHNIPFDPRLVMESDFTYDDGLRLANQFLSLTPRPTAVFGSNDLTAIGCMVGLKQRGIRVPKEISVVGFDDIDAAKYVDPPLTTIRVPMFEMGKLGAIKLLGAMINEPLQALILLRHELIVRDSSGPKSISE